MAVVGCEEPADLRSESGRAIPKTTDVWVASDMSEVTEATPRFEDAQILSGDGETVFLSAGANETVSFQLFIDAPAGGLPAVRILPGDLNTADGKSKLPAGVIHLFRMLPVKVGKFPAWYLRLAERAPSSTPRYDPLVPTSVSPGGQPYRLRRGERLAVWVDLAVPRTAKAGIYRGAVRIDTGQMQGYRFDVELMVQNFVLPDVRPFAAVGGFSYESICREFLRRDGKPFVPTHLDADDPATANVVSLLRKMVVLGHEHRLDLFDKTLRPRIQRDTRGRMKLDWQSYDAVVKPFLDGSAFADRTGVSAWPIPYRDDWPRAKYYGGFNAPMYRGTAKEIVIKCGRHFRTLGADDQMFAWPYRKISSDRDEKYKQLFLLADIVHQADAGIPVLSTLPTIRSFGPSFDYIDHKDSSINIIAPDAQWLIPDEAVKWRTPGRPLDGVWLLPGDVPYLPSLSLFASPADIRALPWFAAKYKCTGLFLPEVLHWNGDVLNTPAGEEIRLFYPGKPLGLNRILPSVRLKRLRRGLQDVGYLWTLQQHQRSGISKAILNAMARYAGLDAAGDHRLDARIDGWGKDGSTWIEARKLMTEEVLQALHPKPSTERSRIADQVRWKRFTDLTSRIVVERVQTLVRGANLNLSTIPDTPEKNVQNLHATVLASLYNEFDRPLEAKVEVASLPDGWKPIIGEYTIPRLAPGGQRDAKLVMEGVDVPVTPDGKMPITLKVSAEPNTRKTLQTEVAFLVAGTFHKPPTLDGRLDDWPIRPRAAAGRFRLLGRRGQKTSPRGDGLAQRRTFAFAMQDEKNLYFAFRCDEPNVEGMTVHNDNFVRYEQLLACGEDVVEILLDPGAKASGPEDLYHILVKPNGVAVQEIGVRTDPPLGRSRPFPLGAKVAAARHKDYWSVEIAVPRSAFGADGNEPFWGVNFTRFAPQGSEASSWSGASRYFYDPRSLGTMYIPPPKSMESQTRPQ